MFKSVVCLLLVSCLVASARAACSSRQLDEQQETGSGVGDKKCMMCVIKCAVECKTDVRRCGLCIMGCLRLDSPALPATDVQRFTMDNGVAAQGGECTKCALRCASKCHRLSWDCTKCVAKCLLPTDVQLLFDDKVDEVNRDGLENCELPCTPLYSDKSSYDACVRNNCRSRIQS